MGKYADRYIYKIQLVNLDFKKLKLKRGKRSFDFSTGFFSDPVILQFNASTLLFLIYLWSVCFEQGHNVVTLDVRQLPPNLGMRRVSLESAINKLRFYNLVTDL